jgi:hypothetical protein
MTATQDSHDEVPGPAEDGYSESEEEEIAARLEALRYQE